MSRRAHEPVRRRRVLAGTVVALVTFAGLVGLAEWLRHPPPGVDRPVELDETDGDPRITTTCPEPAPSEAQERGGRRRLGPAQPPVTVTSNQLQDCPELYDRRVVRYQGEAVGGVLRRGGGAWVQMNDDVYAGTLGPLPAHRGYRGGNSGVGVFLPGDLADQISVVGGPATRGDLVEVIGVFRRVDPASLEVTVVRARSLEILRPGEPFADVPLRDRQVAAGVLALLAVAVVITERTLARRRLRP